MPKISIITPTYNSSPFIKRTIQSVLSQTFTDWEYLIVDDGSTDNTIEVVQKFIKVDPRIKLLKTPQNSGGPALPKNIGIENAKGEYIAFLDHDDEWLPEKLEKQIKMFEESTDEKLGLVSCFLEIRNNDTGNIILKYNDFYKNESLNVLLQYNFLATSSCVMVKTEIFKKFGLFDTQFKISDDWDMWLRIAKAGYGFNYVPDYLIHYNTHKNNFSSDIERGFQDFNILCRKNENSTFKIEKSWFLSYYYFNKKNYKLARKYYVNSMFSKRLNLNKKIKSFMYILLTFFPKFRDLFKNLFFNIKSSNI